jgi:hypothetical protein
MFLLRAPYPQLQTTTLLPSPAFSDSEALTDTLITRRSTNGTLRTYVRTKNGRRKLQWTFRLSRPKSLELREFLRSYHSWPIEVQDHRNRRWTGFLTNNPFEFEAQGRAAPGHDDLPGERHVITLEFEGVEL